MLGLRCNQGGEHTMSSTPDNVHVLVANDFFVE